MYYTRQDHEASITIRPARANDAEALRRIAQRDSASVPDGRLLVAAADGELRAAVSITNGEGIADPFHPSAGLARLLSARAAQLRGSGDGLLARHLGRLEVATDHKDERNHMADTYTVERKIRIDTPASAVYERIVDFHRWPAWSPYERLDPDMDRRYAGAESGVGAVYEWSGNLKAGAGRMEIVDTVDDERVVIDQRNLKPFRSESSTSFALDDSGDGTAVTWSMTGPVTLMTRIMGIFKSMDRMVGPLFEKGLARLKADAEAA